MDDLRLALLIAGLVVVAGIYAFARVSRRRAARKAERPDLVAPESRDEHGYAPDDGGTRDAGSTDDATGPGRAFEESGTGCPGGAGVPMLTATDAPWLGRTVSIGVAIARPVASALARTSASGWQISISS